MCCAYDGCNRWFKKGRAIQMGTSAGDLRRPTTSGFPRVDRFRMPALSRVCPDVVSGPCGEIGARFLSLTSGSTVVRGSSSGAGPSFEMERSSGGCCKMFGIGARHSRDDLGLQMRRSGCLVTGEWGRFGFTAIKHQCINNDCSVPTVPPKKRKAMSADSEKTRRKLART